MGERQNITLSLPVTLLRRVKRLAAQRETSVTALMIEALRRVGEEDRRFAAARRRNLAALAAARSLGSGGRASWTRDTLHEH
jgi:hypothetical protein